MLRHSRSTFSSTLEHGMSNLHEDRSYLRWSEIPLGWHVGGSKRQWRTRRTPVSAGDTALITTRTANLFPSHLHARIMSAERKTKTTNRRPGRLFSAPDSRSPSTAFQRKFRTTAIASKHRPWPPDTKHVRRGRHMLLFNTAFHTLTRIECVRVYMYIYHAYIQNSI